MRRPLIEVFGYYLIPGGEALGDLERIVFLFRSSYPGGFLHEFSGVL